MLVADERLDIVGISAEVAAFLGYDDPSLLVGRRVLAIVPPRFHQAHVAGTTMHGANGRDVLLDRVVEVPVLRADGSEVAARFEISAQRLDSGERVFVARFELPEHAGPERPDRSGRARSVSRTAQPGHQLVGQVALLGQAREERPVVRQPLAHPQLEVGALERSRPARPAARTAARRARGCRPASAPGPARRGRASPGEMRGSSRPCGPAYSRAAPCRARLLSSGSSRSAATVPASVITASTHGESSTLARGRVGALVAQLLEQGQRQPAAGGVPGQHRRGPSGRGARGWRPRPRPRGPSAAVSSTVCSGASG